jgi:hypothetical protein
MRIALLAAIAAMILGFAPPLAVSADETGSTDAGVARISLIEGAVAVQRGDSNAPVDAVINAPVLGADYVTTGQGGRAEVQFDAASAVRLGSNVQMRFTHLDSGSRELQLAEGTIEVRMLRQFDGSTLIDTPSISVRPREAGSYRISVTADGATYVTVRSGAADIVTPQGDRPLFSGRTLIARGEASSPSIETVSAIAFDDFDRFNQDRDQRAESALDQTSAYVNPSVQGVDDLDQYGRWVPDANYGEVWVPSNVAADWAPYRDGRWVWEDGYGWTWLGYEPWGWAPYHYGRWYHSAAYGWAWYPPRRGFDYEPWRPALVGFLGFGSPGFSVGFGFGNIGWVPLAPYEPFHPWWGRTVVNNVTNVTNVYNNYGNVTRVYRNAGYGGATAVPGQRFMLGRFDHPIALTPGQLRQVHLVRGAVPIVPTTANLRFNDRPAPVALAVHSTFVQHGFAGNAIAVRRTPFEQQRTAISTATHLGATPGALHVLPETGTIVHGAYTPARPSASAAGFAQPQRSTPRLERGSSTDPWARFSQSRGGGTAAVHGSVVQPVTHGGETVRSTTVSPWSRFPTSGEAGVHGGGSYRAPSHTYAAPDRGSVEPTHGYNAAARPIGQPIYRQAPPAGAYENRSAPHASAPNPAPPHQAGHENGAHPPAPHAEHGGGPTH